MAATADHPSVTAVPEAETISIEPLPAETVRLSYVGHSTYYLETTGGLSVATDYTGPLGPAGPVPTVVTMNHAHDSHWTPWPDERIAHVLQGWDYTANRRNIISTLAIC